MVPAPLAPRAAYGRSNQSCPPTIDSSFILTQNPFSSIRSILPAQINSYTEGEFSSVRRRFKRGDRHRRRFKRVGRRSVPGDQFPPSDLKPSLLTFPSLPPSDLKTSPRSHLTHIGGTRYKTVGTFGAPRPVCLGRSAQLFFGRGLFIV